MSQASSKLIDVDRPPLWASVAVCAIVAISMVLLRDVLYRGWALPVGYGVPIVVSAWTRRRWFIWVLAALFASLAIGRFIGSIVAMPAPRPMSVVLTEIASTAMVLLDLLVVSALVDRFLHRHLLVEERGAELKARNEELIARREEIARQNEALKRQAEELETRRLDAEAASVRKSKFLAAVSHDIRTPANAISLLAELLQRTAASPESAEEIPELTRELHNSAMSLVGLVSDVLDLTRLDAGRVDLHESDFELNQLLLDDCKQLSPLAEQKGLAFECTLPEEKVRVHADRIKLSRVVTNLIGNAIKFTEKGSVQISARIGTEGRPTITVTDTGIGIEAKHLAMIFDEFFQLQNPERNRQKGTGLGLSISKRLMEAMGGRLEVVSTPSKGSTFTITLPDKSVIR